MIDWPFLSALLALCVFGAVLRNWRMAGTAVFLTLNWGITTAYVYRTGDVYPWPVFGAADYVAAFCILRMLPGQASLWQAGVGAIYAAMLVCHGAYGYCVLNGWDLTAPLYHGYWFLYYASSAQVIVVACWGGYDLYRRRSPARWGASSVDAVMERADAL